MSLLQAEGINKNYSGYQALSDINLSIEKGKVFGLLGPNGAGKTTFIRIINQITGPDSGTILLDGKPLKAQDIQRIGYLPEERGLYPNMKVGDQAIYLAQLKGLDKKTAIKRLKPWFEKFELMPWWNKKLSELSKGMQQKVQFITTVLHEPELLIFDEPFSGFDPINTKLLKEEILNLRDKGATIIFSTHNMSSVEEVCDDIALFNQSKKIIEGNVQEIRRSHRSGLYEVAYVGRDANGLFDTHKEQFEIIKQEQDEWENRITLKTLQEQKGNELLSQLMPLVEISSFKEHLPSMNEVFVSLVEQNNN
jgi:ABC-2 type transport system ATP-binding protein